MSDTPPTVTLAGKEWPVGEMTWIQLRTCRHALLELTARINVAVAAAPPGPDGEDEDDRFWRGMAVVTTVFSELSDDDYDRLVMTPIFALLTVLNPGITREAFNSWCTGESERQRAWFAARTHSGLFVFRGLPGNAEAKEEHPQPGEAEGAP